MKALKLISCLLFTIFLILASSPGFACKGTDVLFQDNFSKMDPSWGTPNPQKRVENNAFVLEPNLGITYDVVNQTVLLQDMDYCIDVKLAKGDATTYGGGLVFWAKDVDDYYFLYILTDGSYYVGRYAGGRYMHPVGIQKTQAINTSPGAVNHLRVVTKGNQATVYINDAQLATFTGQVPEGGGLIGVAGDSGKSVKNTWMFTNLKITKPL